MGCDFFWSGHIADPAKQQKAIYFVRRYFNNQSKIARYFEPKPDLLLPTLIEDRGNERFEQAYPFNFFGIAPWFNYSDSDIRERWQFVFDRSNGGQMVSILETPETIAQYGRDFDEKEYQVRLHTGGYDRFVGGGSFFGLILNVVRLRYADDLRAGDDYDVFNSIKTDIENWQLAPFLRGETEGPEQCWDLFVREYSRRRQSSDR